jgi:hypothetical protein
LFFGCLALANRSFVGLGAAFFCPPMASFVHHCASIMSFTHFTWLLEVEKRTKCEAIFCFHSQCRATELKVPYHMQPNVALLAVHPHVRMERSQQSGDVLVIPIFALKVTISNLSQHLVGKRQGQLVLSRGTFTPLPQKQNRANPAQTVPASVVVRKPVVGINAAIVDGQGVNFMYGSEVKSIH